MNYWEIIADNLKKAAWSLGWVSAVDSQGRTMWIIDGIATTGSILSLAQMKSQRRF